MEEMKGWADFHEATRLHELNGLYYRLSDK